MSSRPTGASASVDTRARSVNAPAGAARGEFCNDIAVRTVVADDTGFKTVYSYWLALFFLP